MVMPSIRRPAWLVIIACTALALLLRVYYVNVAIVDHPIRGDATAYYAYAWNMLHNGVFSHVFPGDGPPLTDSYRDPGYPVLIAATMWLAGPDDWYRALLNLQALLSALTVLVTLTLGRRWLPLPWLALCGVLLAIWPHSITSASYLLTETLCGFLVSTGIVLASLPAARKPATTFAIGLAMGAAALTNAILLPFGVLLAIGMLLSRQWPRHAALALVIGSSLLPGIWALRNATLSAGIDATTSTSTGRALQNLVQGSWPEYHDAWHGTLRGDPAAKALMHQIDDEIAAAVASPPLGLSIVADRLAASPWRYARWYLSKPALQWGWDVRIGAGDVFIYPMIWSPYLSSPVFKAMAALTHALNPWLLLLAAAFCATALAQRPGRGHEWIPTTLLLLYVTAIYGILQSEPRYSIPFRSMEILAAMAMLAAVSRKLHRTARGTERETPRQDAHGAHSPGQRDACSQGHADA